MVALKQDRELAYLGVLLTMLFGIMITIVAASGWIFAGRALKPVNNLIEEVQEVSVEDLRHRLALRAHNGEVVLFHPQHAVEQPLPLQNLPRPHLEHVAIHVVDIFLAAKFRFVNRQQFLHQHERLDIPDIGEILFGQLEIL